jgi:hypothetical protein
MKNLLHIIIFITITTIGHNHLPYGSLVSSPSPTTIVLVPCFLKYVHIRHRFTHPADFALEIRKGKLR